MPGMKIKHRFRIIFGVFSALIAHAIEIWIFALAYYFMNKSVDWGSLQGNFGGIAPIKHLRYLTGIESLTGLVLITWTASFLYFEMQHYWDSK